MNELDLRPFPMQDGPPIPWFLAEAIWKHLYRESQPLETMAQRGGFGWDEVSFMWKDPKWRTTRNQRRACAAQVRTALDCWTPALYCGLLFTAAVVFATLGWAASATICLGAMVLGPILVTMLLTSLATDQGEEHEADDQRGE